MAEIMGKMKADLLIRWHGSKDEPTVITTVEVPIHSEPAGDGVAMLQVDASVFERVGKAIAVALEREANPELAVQATQRRLAEAMGKLSPNARQIIHF